VEADTSWLVRYSYLFTEKQLLPRFVWGVELVALGSKKLREFLTSWWTVLPGVNVVGLIPAIGESRSSAYSNKQMHGRHFVKEVIQNFKKKKKNLCRKDLPWVWSILLILAVYFLCNVVMYCNKKLRTYKEVSYGEVLGDKSVMYIRMTLYWEYLIILWQFLLGTSCTVVVLTCFVMCRCVYVWVL